MIDVAGRAFREVWLVDFEYNGTPGDVVLPVCLVAHELGSGQTLRLWSDEFGGLTVPPYATDSETLFVAYYASAELGCHLALGWPQPENVLDLFAEFRKVTNGTVVSAKAGLLDALAWYGIGAIGADEKKAMRKLILSGGPWSEAERLSILDYCETDVVALTKLLAVMKGAFEPLPAMNGPLEPLPTMKGTLELRRALLRGRYMKAAAKIEHIGVPIDLPMLQHLRQRWVDIQGGLVAAVDVDYGVYEGQSFREHRFAEYLAARGIGWPRHPTGRLQLDDDTFRDIAKAHPDLSPLRELRVTLGQMRLSELAVGADGRNRCLLSAFQARAGRNQPSNAKFIFGPAVWLRGLIRPAPGWGVAYIDWSQQEFGIAAALSGDAMMQEAYKSGDPYLAFAKQAGTVPPDATKQSHGAVRDQFKACVLAVQYGMGTESLALRIGQPTYHARALLELHRRTYPRFWKWSDACLDYANLYLSLHTTFGWRIQVSSDANPRSLRNFPMQANGAEMLRLACCLVTEAGIRVCAPVHDALLIEAPLDELRAAIATTQELMAQASAIVLGGFRLRSDVKIVRYPDRYMDERGEKLWAKIVALAGETSGSVPEVGLARCQTCSIY